MQGFMSNKANRLYLSIHYETQSYYWIVDILMHTY